MKKPGKKIAIISAGMGNPETLTAEAAGWIREAELLLGARRLVEPWMTETERIHGEAGNTEQLKSAGGAGKRKRIAAEYRPAEIRRIVDACEEENIGILVSGDAGFFSGAAGIADALEEYSPVVVPGVSSAAYLSAKTGIPYSGANIISAHGRPVNIVSEVARHRVTYVLGGGNIPFLLKMLDRFAMNDVMVHVGENLGSHREKISSGRPEELMGSSFETLAVMAVLNEKPWKGSGRLRDEEFLRGKVPMTKELVRAAVLRQLDLSEDAVVYDIGAGTGAMAVEMARSAWRGRVYAVEYKENALELIAGNRLRFRADNLEIVPGRAPAALEDLPVPDAVFIGGSEGSLDDILRCIHNKRTDHQPSSGNEADSGAEKLSGKHGGRPGPIRVVITAVTLQTLQEGVELMRKYSREKGIEITQVSETRLNRVGRYDMFRPETPVFIISGWIQATTDFIHFSRSDSVIVE